MKQIRLIIAVTAFISFFAAASSSYADENTLREVFQDAFYGAGIGALVGGALIAFTKKPADHLNNIGYGAAVGVLAGTAFGLAKSSRALAEIDNGNIRIAVPTIVPDLVVSPSTRQNTIMWCASILRGTFN
jgi:peptidoglycan/LPS O-acetylase OafA/YrhL